MYFVIHNSDGETTVEKMSKEKLLERINDEHYGKVEFIDGIGNNDTNYWGDDILIIRGEIVVPKPKKIVETYDIF